MILDLIQNEDKRISMSSKKYKNYI